MDIVGELLSGLIGAILGAGISFLTLRYNYRDLYARSISANRMDWINNFREEIATIIAALDCNAKSKDGKHPPPHTQEDDIIYKAYKARAKLQTRLNMDTSKIGNEFNKVMSDILKDIDFENPCPKSKDTLINLSREILEPEWKRVKKEAGGDKK